MANRYKFTTTLQGFIRVDADGGKFNNRGFEFTIPADTLETIDKDRLELINWIKTKETTKRLPDGLAPWDDSGTMKYSYGKGDGSRKPKQEPVFVDATGAPIERAVLKDVRKGTKVRILLQQKPFAMGTFNTSVRVIGVQIIELATGNGAVDSGDLSVDEVAALFGTTDGFSQSDPAVRQAEEPVAAGDSYDF
jgi:hypothetical protein